MKAIVVTGTHAVGKTVLCKRLIDAVSGSRDAKMIPEMARILIAQGIAMNNKATEFGIVSYIREYLKHWRHVKADLLISDRSVLDLLAYISVSRPMEVREEFISLTEEIVYQEVERVDVYAYVPIEFDMVVDDVRPDDVRYRQTVDDKIRHLLKHFGAKAITVSGSVEQRVAAVRRWLDVQL
jgi:predicted ATPase